MLIFKKLSLRPFPYLSVRFKSLKPYSKHAFLSGDYDITKTFPKDSYEFNYIRNLANGIKNKDRATLARAITLVESTNKQKKLMGQILLQLVISETSRSSQKSFRIGLSGPPGAGKSTFIETMGSYLTEKHDLKVAILAVDPSSSRTGGSLLGDKTRMTNLSRNPKAYIRPSPAQGTLGGVTRNTTEAMILCESAGYDVIIVETVGVGQSEVAVADMTDLFVLLIPPASGDELQGIKRGIIEMTDLVVINKADGDLLPAARRLQSEYTSALKFIPRKHNFWRQRVRRVSSITEEGISELWSVMQIFHEEMIKSGTFESLRRNQRAIWMWNHIKDNILEDFASDYDVSKALPSLEEQVKNCKMTPGLAADLLLNCLFKKDDKNR
ncbi:methylmalonic aciduria type A protein, mitochondrial-like [Styela clava]